jgi:hypothetical protein
MAHRCHVRARAHCSGFRSGQSIPVSRSTILFRWFGSPLLRLVTHAGIRRRNQQVRIFQTGKRCSIQGNWPRNVRSANRSRAAKRTGSRAGSDRLSDSPAPGVPFGTIVYQHYLRYWTVPCHGVRRLHSCQVAPGTRWRRRDDRQPSIAPRFKTSNDIADVLEAEVDECGCCQAGREAVVTEEDNLLIESRDKWAPPLTVRIQTPLQHGARYVEGTGHDAVVRAVRIGPNVNQQCPVTCVSEGTRRFDSIDAGSGLVE